jgi:hypothetical protein
MKSALAFVIVALICVSASAQESPLDFLVQSRIDGSRQNYGDPIFLRRHDWGPPSVPLGYGVSDNVMTSANSVVQTWSYGPTPGPFVQANGDGGQISSIIGTRANFWATQDGSYPGLQYFVGASCPGGEGWLLFDTAHQINSQWVGQIAHLAISKESPTDCPLLGAAYTRWMRGLVVYPFKVSGQPSGSLVLDTLLSFACCRPIL